MSSLARLRTSSPRKSPPKSPTSSPNVRPPDPTITSTLPFLRDILSTPGEHNSASFLRNIFPELLRLQHDIIHSDEVDPVDRITLQEMKDLINLTKTIRGIPGNEASRFHLVEYNTETHAVQNFWSVLVPVYRLSQDVGQRPTLNLANVSLLEKNKEAEIAAKALSQEDYERLLYVLISHIFRILGSDCVPVVMRPVTTEHLRGYIEPLTRLGKWDSIEFPAIDGEDRPRFRLLGLSDKEIQNRGWTREGEFGWAHIRDQETSEEEMGHDRDG